MTTEELLQRQSEMSDRELIELCETEVSQLCMTGGKNLTMTVPPKITDTDMVLSELINRYKNKING